MQHYNDLLPLTPDMNKERLEQLKQLMPDLFTNEGKLNIDEVRKLAEPERVAETERYEFRWFGKTQAKRNAFTPSNATLVLDEKRSYLPKQDGAEPRHLILEGENLEVLKLLLAGYRERIKCIYIDPPYNTGQDFVYSDNYTEDRKPYWEQTGVTEQGVKIDTNTEADGRYHSNWLNMMYSRLLLARQLLRPDGVIFISIDDNEVTNLRKLMDEVFGEENFVAEFVWHSKKGGGSDSGSVVIDHEYILGYLKDCDSSRLGRVELEAEPLDKEDAKGKYRLGRELNKWGSNSRRQDRPTMWFPIVGPNDQDVYPIRNDGSEGCWRWGKKKMLDAAENGDIEFVLRDNGTYIAFEKIRGEDIRLKPHRSMLLNTGTTADGSKTLKEIFDNVKTFDYSKPISLLRQVIAIACEIDSNDIVLDFFAGSGTTGQAVMELNEEDGGNRQFILVQIPEATDPASEAHKAGYKKISDITIERNRRVAEKIVSSRNEKPATLFDGDNPAPPAVGFKVYELQKSNFPRTEWTPDPALSMEQNVAALPEYIRLKESQLVTMFNKRELMTEILLKQGFTLHFTAEVMPEFTKNEIHLITEQTDAGAANTSPKQVLLCLDVTLENETLEYFRTHTDRKLICLERALDTTKKWNLKHYLGDNFYAF